MPKEKEKKTNDSKTLYKDKYCKLTKSHLRIRTYYFPTTQDKLIEISKIQKIYYKKQNLWEDCCRVKGWGMSLTPVWWAYDLARGLHGSSADYYNVAIDTGCSIMKGFTVVNIEEFLSYMKQLVSAEKFIADEIPS